MPPPQVLDQEEVPPTQHTMGTDALSATLRGGDALDDAQLTAAPTQDTVAAASSKIAIAAHNSSNTAEYVGLTAAPAYDTVAGTAGDDGLAAPTQDTVMGTAQEEDARESQAQAVSSQGTASCSSILLRQAAQLIGCTAGHLKACM